MVVWEMRAWRSTRLDKLLLDLARLQRFTLMASEGNHIQTVVALGSMTPWHELFSFGRSTASSDHRLARN